MANLVGASRGLIEEARSRSGESSPIPPSNLSADATAAHITRAQWQHFLDTYRPVENDVLRSVMQTDFSAEGDKAGLEAGAQIDVARGSLMRNLRRAGTRLTAEERQALSRRSNLARTRATGRAENTTRRGLADTRQQMLGQIVNIGRGVASTASGGMQSVADMAAAREAQYKAQKSAMVGQGISMAASAAALLIAL